VPVAERGRGGLMLPMPPRELVEPAAARPRRTNPARAREQLELGDRSFRGGNTKRAEERYVLASKADAASPMPHVHLAQVSLVRKNYAIAAKQIRSAITAAQGSAWLANAPDIQTMYAEPGDFARHLAKLESHLQANPGDRDAWFVYGVEWYLSGRTQQAADAFRRLTDRRPDEALSAFLDAANLRRPAAN
jgi:tetratricopeptide (TPR) repeat protein